MAKQSNVESKESFLRRVKRPTTQEHDADLDVLDHPGPISIQTLMAIMRRQRMENTNPVSGACFKCPDCGVRFSMAWGRWVQRKNFEEPCFVCKDCQRIKNYTKL